MLNQQQSLLRHRNRFANAKIENWFVLFSRSIDNTNRHQQLCTSCRYFSVSESLDATLMSSIALHRSIFDRSIVQCSVQNYHISAINILRMSMKTLRFGRLCRISDLRIDMKNYRFFFRVCCFCFARRIFVLFSKRFQLRILNGCDCDVRWRKTAFDVMILAWMVEMMKNVN